MKSLPIPIRAIVFGSVTLMVAACGSGGGQPQGAEQGPCYPNHTCNSGLVCLSEVCVVPGDGSSLVPEGPVSRDAGSSDSGTMADAPVASGEAGTASEGNPASSSPGVLDASITVDSGGRIDVVGSADSWGSGGMLGTVADATGSGGVLGSVGAGGTMIIDASSAGGTPSSGGITGTGASISGATGGVAGGTTTTGGSTGSGGSVGSVCIMGSSAGVDTCIVAPAGRTITSCNPSAPSTTAVLATSCPTGAWGQCGWNGDTSIAQVFLYGATMDLCENGKVDLVGAQPGPGIVLFSDGKAVGAMTGGGFVASGSADTITNPTSGDAGTPNWSSTDELCLTGSLPALPLAPTSADYNSNWMILGVVANAEGPGIGIGQPFSSLTVWMTGSTVGLQLTAHLKGDDSATTYCSTFVPGYPVTLTQFITDCYSPSPKGTKLAATDIPNIDQITVHISPSTAGPITVTNLCLTRMQFR